MNCATFNSLSSFHVKVRDAITKVCCDLNMRNRMGVLNTSYIRFCADFDDRARDLMMVVKAFCKRHQLTEGSDHLNNYSLVCWLLYSFRVMKLDLNILLLGANGDLLLANPIYSPPTIPAAGGAWS